MVLVRCRALRFHVAIINACYSFQHRLDADRAYSGLRHTLGIRYRRDRLGWGQWLPKCIGLSQYTLGIPYLSLSGGVYLSRLWVWFGNGYCDLLHHLDPYGHSAAAIPTFYLL